MQEESKHIIVNSLNNKMTKKHQQIFKIISNGPEEFIHATVLWMKMKMLKYSRNERLEKLFSEKLI